MVDNVSITPGTGATVAADDIGGGVLAQRVKIGHGGDGSYTEVQNSAPFPVKVTDGTNPVTVVAASTSPATTDPALAVSISPNSDIIGAKGETAPITDTGSSGLNGRLQRIAQRITSLIALFPAALGQTTKSASFPVVIASDDDLQGKIGGLTESAPVTDTGSSGLNGRLQRIAQRLTTIAGQIPSSLGQFNKAGSLSVTTASDDDLQAKLGIVTETAPASDTASSGLNGRLQRIAQRLTTLIGAIPSALGQSNKAGSLTVTVASDDDLQGKLGALTETAPGTDTASSGLNGRLQRIAQRLTTLIGQHPTSLGQTTKTGSMSVVLASDDDIQAKIGIVTETAPASDTASSGLNGRLQRIAQRLTSLIGLLPTALGQTTMANSLAVAIASNQSALSVTSANGLLKLTASFTRPADTTAYAAGDLCANSTTAGSVTPLTFSNAVRASADGVRIERARIRKSSTSLTNATFRLHLFESSPTLSVGDNAAFNSSGVLGVNNALAYLGSIAVTMQNSGSDGAIGLGVPLVGNGIVAQPSATTIYGLLEVTGAYTPTSGETIAVDLECFRP